MTGRSTLPSALRFPTRGDVIAQKYMLERCLGEGGQGCVWQAQNLVLELPVAIKLVHPEAIHGLVPERLFREARAAATLGHPSIVRVFDIGRTVEGLPYLVMELLRGESLADAVTRAGQLAPAHAVRLLLPIADGLVAAHAQGIIHRDVKPDNVFVAVSGDWVQPKLLDFGLARRSASSDQLRRLTEAGAILGTPAYLSPEQASGKGEVDERADIWSFCATLYECVAGIVPFQGTSWHQLRRQILRDEPKALGDYGVDDPDLWGLLRRGLAKSPDERWSTMQDLGRALASWLLERGVSSDICGVLLDARWLRPESPAPSLRASPVMPAVSSAPRPARGQTLRIERSATRRRAAHTREQHAPTPARSPQWRRLIYGAAVAVACIALSVLMTATQRARGGDNGIIASSQAAAPPTPTQRSEPSTPQAPAVPPPIVAPVAEESPASVAAPTSPKPAHPRPTPATAPPVRQAAPVPSQRGSPPAELKAARPKVEPLDLMEPY